MKSVQRAFSSRTIQLALIGLIFLLSFLTFSTLFTATPGDSYYREIIAALIGTILAAVITTMLLASQTKGEELKERNVEVFRKKVDAYETFLDQILRSTDDWELSDEEVLELRRSVYRLSLFSGEDTITVVTNYLRSLYVQDTDSDCDLSDVISAFRKELALENVDELASYDMGAVESFLRVSDRASFENVRTALETFRTALSEKLATDGRDFDCSKPSGLGDGLSFGLSCTSGLTYGFSLDYELDGDNPPMIDGYLDCSELPRKSASKVRQLALAEGFEDDPESIPDELLPGFIVDPDPQASPGKISDNHRVWTISELAQTIVKLENAARSSLRNKRQSSST